MTAIDLINLINQVLFVGLFVAVLWHAVREPSRANTDTALLFASVAGTVLLARAADLLGLDSPLLTGVTAILLAAAPLAMLRLVDDFSGTPRWVQWAGAGAYALLAVFTLTGFETRPALVEVALIGWFGIVGAYAAVAFARAAQRSRGITRARMAAVAFGAVAFMGAILVLLLAALTQAEELSVVAQLISLASVVAFFLGFAPPAWVRRAWREPELRRFLQSSIHLAAMDDERTALVELQRAAADAFGARGASIGVADVERGVIRYPSRNGGWVEHPADAFIGGMAFTGQRRIVAGDAPSSDPEHAEVYQSVSARTVIAAPITSDDRRLGVLTLYAERAPIFVEDDLWLLELMADHTALLLEARALAAEAAGVRSREDAAKLKEEFLSAAAHDLRTPLTVVLGQAELLERRMARDPSNSVDAAGVSRIAREARRLRDLVSELLDVQRLEQGGTAMEMSDTDLREVVSAVQGRMAEHGLDIRVTVPDGPIFGSIDRVRMEQVVENLVENAVKYTPNGILPEVELSFEADEARLAVIDHGMGIPVEERERIFERFYRAPNVQSVTDTGMGLGLYICRRIVESHGGRIWTEPTPGGGSTFIVAIPAREVATAAQPVPSEPWQMSGAEAAADA
jgi:signal transduction histidine kinase